MELRPALLSLISSETRSGVGRVYVQISSTPPECSCIRLPLRLCEEPLCLFFLYKRETRAPDQLKEHFLHQFVALGIGTKLGVQPLGKFRINPATT